MTNIRFHSLEQNVQRTRAGPHLLSRSCLYSISQPRTRKGKKQHFVEQFKVFKNIFPILFSQLDGPVYARQPTFYHQI